MRVVVASAMAVLLCKHMLLGQFWQEVPIEAPDDVTPNGRFGAALATHGDLLLVGAPDVDAGAPGAGAAYLYQRNSEGLNTWGFVQRILPPTPFTGGGFGTRVLFHGPYMFISAPRERVAGITRGAVHAYRSDPISGIWLHEQRLTSDINQWDLATGVDLAGAADVLLAHASGFDPVPADEAPGCGALLSFRPDAVGTYEFTRTIRGDQLVPGSNARALQGWSAACGSSLVYIGLDAKAYRLPLGAVLSDAQPLPTPVPVQIGAPFHPVDPSFRVMYGTSNGNSIHLVVSEPIPDPPPPPAPAAYYACIQFTCVDDELVQQGYFVSDTANNDVIWLWGASLAAGDGAVIVGDPGDLSFTPLGYAEVFRPDASSATQWSRSGLLIPSDPEYGARFGMAVAVGAGFAVVGAPEQGEQDRGKVYGFVDPFTGVPFRSSGSTMAIRPNPVRSDDANVSLWVEAPSRTGQLRVTRTDGRVVGERTVHGPMTWDMTGVGPGSYVVQWSPLQGEEPPRSVKFIVVP